MKGDFSRNTYNPIQHYTSVLQQQGRVSIDADWNEQQAIHEFQRNTRSIDALGFNGSPKYRNNGFAIENSGGNWSISSGHFYVDGILCINESDTQISQQPFPYRNIPDFNTLNQALVYIEVWQHHVTATDDDMIRETALGGADTASRSKVVWQVHAVELAAVRDPEAILDALRNQQSLGIPEWDSIIAPLGGTLAARTNPAGVTTSPCELPPDAGFLGLENQLYRVEIHQGGNNPSFKWSRNNAAFEVAVETMLSRSEIQLSSVGLDDILRFKNGDWIEFIGLPDELSDGHGQLREVSNVDPDTRTITLATSLNNLITDNAIDSGRYRVRLWDQTGSGTTVNGVDITGTWMTLENGLQVHFSDLSTTGFRSGDYWLIPARTVKGDIEWPPYNADVNGFAPPQGISRHYAPLALVSSNNKVDLRLNIPPLNHLQAEDIRYDDSACGLGVDNVQDAIEALCSRGSQGHCVIFARNTEELVNAVNNLGAAKNVHICLAENDFILDSPLNLARFNYVRITGAGPGTLLTASKSEVAILIQECGRVELFDLHVRGQKAEEGNRSQRHGALTIKNTSSVLVERVYAECRWSDWRQQSCISIYGNRNTSSIVVRDCGLHVGQGQIGLQVTNPRRVLIENNHIIAATPFLRENVIRFRRDTLLIRNIVAGAIALPGSKTDRSAMIRSIRKKINVRTASGSTSVELVVHPELVNPINNYLQNRGKELTIANDLELFTHLRKTLARAIREGGSFTAGNRFISEFSSFVNDMTGETEVYCDDGIIIAGASIGDVHISNNDIKGTINGIRVASSHHNNPNPPNWKRARPENTAEKVVIICNSIFVNPVAPSKASDGIHIGHFDSLIVKENRINFMSRQSNADKSYWNGIRTYGWRGPLMRVVENTIYDTHTGISVRPNTKPLSGQHWDIVHNGYQNVTDYIDVGGSINTTGNHE